MFQDLHHVKLEADLLDKWQNYEVNSIKDRRLCIAGIVSGFCIYL